MADRTVNVTINYKVNTAEVQKAQAASIAAQRATDQLRKSAQQYGTDSSRAFKQSADSAKAAQREVSSLDKGFGSLYTSVKLFLTAGLAKELFDLTLGMAKLSGTIDGVSTAFKRLPNATLLLNELRRATHGTVTDLELMQKALRANNFRIPLEKLGTLLEFATVKAQQTGQEVNHLVEYIVSGIGYRSIKRLDDLGFTLNRVKEALGGVSLQAASMGQVMDAVTKLMQEDLEETGGYTETSATKVGILERKWNDLKVAFSQKVESSPLLDYLSTSLDRITLAIKAFPVDRLKKLFTLDSVNPIKETLGDFLDIFAYWQVGIGEVTEQTELNNRAQEEAARIEERLSKLTASQRLPLIDEEIKKKRKVAEEYFYQLQAMDMTNQKFSEENTARRLNLKEIEATIKILEEYRKAQIDATVGAGEESLGIIAKKRDEIEKLQDAIDSTTKAGDLGKGGILTTALAKAEKELEDLLGKTKEKTKEVGEEVREYLAGLSDNELLATKEILEDKAEQRKKTAEEEVRIEKEAKEAREKLAKEEAEKEKQLRQEVASLTEDLIRSTVDLALTHRDDDISNLETYYDEQIKLAGDNERAKKELEIKRDREVEKLRDVEKEREKKAAATRILIDGLIAISKIFSEFGWPAGIAPAAIMAGITAVNVAQVRKYAHGALNIPGPGTETSDSIPAMLSRGESVMTAEETRKNFGLLSMMKENKIDDRIMKSIDFSGGRSFSDARMVEELRSVRAELKRLKSPDIVNQAGAIYEVYTDDQGNKKKIRSRSI